MKILGIETSCDETAVAIVEDGKIVLSNIIASQVDLHAKTGGIVPEVASREHVLKIIPVIEDAFIQAKLDWNDIDAIAVTKGPGLIVCLLIGTNTASTLAMVKNKKLIPVQHTMGHIYSNWLEKNDKRNIQFPIIILAVSGGHNELILMKSHKEFEVIGSTLDDASGEAFDKVARLLNLGYPGGPAISKAALKGDSNAYKLPRAWLGKNSFDFSFSGLKSAVLRLKENENVLHIENAAASFQEAVCDVLSAKLVNAFKKYKAKEVHLAGGVSANLRLRELISERIKQVDEKVIFRVPAEFSYCTDNAAMIASAAYFQYQTNPEKYKKTEQVIADSGLRIEVD